MNTSGSSPMLRMEWDAPGGTNTSVPGPTSSVSSFNVHGAPTLHDDVDLLFVGVGVSGLLAAGRALDPGDEQVLRAELSGGEQQVGHLSAAVVLRAVGQFLDVHFSLPSGHGLLLLADVKSRS